MWNKVTGRNSLFRDDREGWNSKGGFAYRHRVKDVMTSPVVKVGAQTSLSQAIDILQRTGISSLVVQGIRQLGIITEKDVLKAMARYGSSALDKPLEDLMSQPLLTISSDAYIFKAIGRMNRYDIRHLGVRGAEGELVGMISVRALLRERANFALIVGDELSEAKTAQDLKAVWDKMPTLVDALLEESLPARQISAILSAMVRDMSACAVDIAVARMQKEGWEPPATPWSYLVLGSAGRGESLLIPDQDNALVYESDGADEQWFTELGKRASDHLDTAGIPYCKGGVMASQKAWRRSLGEWEKTLAKWTKEAEGRKVLNIDIFYDFRVVAGSSQLAQKLRDTAFAAASDPLLAYLLLDVLEDWSSPFGWFGTLRTEKGQIDIKKLGLHPIVTATRAMALRYDIQEVSTYGRLEALREKSVLNASDYESLADAHETLQDFLLRQQCKDMASGGDPSTKIPLSSLNTPQKKRLKDVLRRAGRAAETARTVMALKN